jgi:hypothetical protein
VQKSDTEVTYVKKMEVDFPDGSSCTSEAHLLLLPFAK